MVGRVVKFLREVKLEMKKVSWSTKNELVAATLVTFFFVAILTVFIGVIDFLLSRVVAYLLK